MSAVLWFSLFSGCFFGPKAPPPATGGEQAPAEATTPTVPPVSFSPLEERVNVLLAEAQETDRRDRLVAARELMLGMRNSDPSSQRKVYAYLDEVLKIEERSRPASIGIDGPIGVPIEEETLPVPNAPTPTAPPVVAPVAPVDESKALATARTAVTESRYLDAVDTLKGLTSPDAATLRKEAIDGYARAERERAGHQFLEARALPPGNERIASLRAVRTALLAINERFPENAYAAAIAENVAKVDADLAAVGAKP